LSQPHRNQPFDWTHLIRRFRSPCGTPDRIVEKWSGTWKTRRILAYHYVAAGLPRKMAHRVEVRNRRYCCQIDVCFLKHRNVFYTAPEWQGIVWNFYTTFILLCAFTMELKIVVKYDYEVSNYHNPKIIIFCDFNL